MAFTSARDTRITTDDVKGSGVLFSSLGLKQELLMGLTQEGFQQLTPVQELAIPHILARRDVVARAKNGTGKTGSFLIPILQMVNPAKDHIQALVLLHTRELAMQTAKVAKTLSKNMPDVTGRIMCAIGGVSIAEDRERAREKPLVVLATPGRLQQLIDEEILNFRDCSIVVLDEADMLLSQNFIRSIENCLAACSNKRRQTLFFSATFSNSLKEFCDKHLRDPEYVNAMQDSLLLRGVTQYVCMLKEDRYKLKLLSLLMKHLKINQCIVFVNSVQRCEALYRSICDEFRVPCLYTHSRMSPEERSRIYDNFIHGQARLLIATELFTRGIDIRMVNVVVNFDTPLSADAYLHRIGRSGRYGHLGIAITMVAGDNEKRRFLTIDSYIQGQANSMIHILPKDPSEIPLDLYDASVVDSDIIPHLSDAIRPRNS
ncbi:putative ATP-dependent RNA helicase p54 [Giardia duodenalis]|uniref:ATP-dependent RNA helicase p54 n=1 Tax=Giardia intestinalis (strain ATCC 50803 / WB clone C6) TaxID=184922 RepID=A8BG41_GIAIC|nr:putative ATP-dependent RNA helicase p54 [Giardia intestinalis]KAE8302224.1 putative ATP-dependent RNA helicase p54 [Giardia intestinalis]|eukprot:XP_001707125.1 ATP-dependent RNA helicase p54, putative [Giardia lamblia ATCC 50803]